MKAAMAAGRICESFIAGFLERIGFRYFVPAMRPERVVVFECEEERGRCKLNTIFFAVEKSAVGDLGGESGVRRKSGGAAGAAADRAPGDWE